MAKEILGELPSDEARNAAYAEHEGLEVFDPDKPLHRQVRHPVQCSVVQGLSQRGCPIFVETRSSCASRSAGTH